MIKIIKMYYLQSILGTKKLIVPHIIKLIHVSTPDITFPHNVRML